MVPISPYRRETWLRRAAAVAALAATLMLPSTDARSDPHPQTPSSARGCAGVIQPAGTAEPRPLHITYYGVSTLVFSDGVDRIVIDGFFTRPRVQQFLRLRSDADEVRARLGEGPPVRAVLVAHAHHDHALDAATIAHQQRYAVVVGTPSVRRLVMAREVAPERACTPADRERMTFGAFDVRAYTVPHGPSPRLLSWILDHELAEGLAGPAWFGAFKDDENLSFLIEHQGRRILVHPSAGLRDLRGLSAQTVFLGMGRVGRMSEVDAQSYFTSTLGPQTSLVVPIHWDRFTTPLSQPLEPMPRLLDNIGLGFQRLCQQTASPRPPRPLVVAVMSAHATLEVPTGQTDLTPDPAWVLCRGGGAVPNE